jgi:chemotaxis protein CheD
MSTQRRTFGRPKTPSPVSRRIVVEMARMEVCDDPSATLVTFGLGSCVAVLVYDPRRRVAGMIHYMLPASETSPERAQQTPAMFGDVGIPLLFERMYAKGCRKEDLVVKAAGGGQLLGDKGTFDIGTRNCDVLRTFLQKNDMVLTREDTGGVQSRTAQMLVGSGEVRIRSKGEEVVL